MNRFIFFTSRRDRGWEAERDLQITSA